MRLIFILDDSSLSLNALSHLLEPEGYKVICLKESEGAVDMIVEAQPDLVLLDVVMPKLSGLEVLRQLKEREECAEMPVIMVTAMTEAQDVSAALEAGAFDYIRKPFEAIEVRARVRSALRTRDYMLKLRYLSERDGLTGLLNHAAFIRALSRELAEPVGGDKALSLVMADLDFFKSVNDKHGHQAGDALLAGLGELLAKAVGRSGEAGRYGGEEFCALLRGYDLGMAGRWAEAFRKVVEERDWDLGSERIKATLSLGVASMEGSIDPAALIAEADRSLYEAKRGGRNRVVMAGRSKGPG
ncbi:MAG TPA: diguanylate cyclase [Spirochaetales bacterium]|nr:diguanylate cyclase [Spirochaetales bacterium]HRY54410.1 diguanylate cyclase [Spirochaetia bacterium]HRZ64446.1 diguanylate cyclase [Spirochaetia bacterium]